MPSPLRDTKSLADWLDLNYHRHPRPLRRLKFLVGVAVLLGCLAAVTAFSLSPRHAVLLQAGPLAPAHAPFNADCSACHTQAFAGASRLWPGSHDTPSVADSACSQCHPGPVHHAQQVRQPGCASCHREHRGRGLTHVADGHCTQCHSHLQRRDGKESVVPPIHSFGADHPEFALWRNGPPRDPGTIHFNHQLHLKANLRGPAGKSVQLECQSCHQPDEQQRYYQTANYEKNCKMCHPLAVQLIGQWANDPLREAAVAFSREPALHREPAVVRADLHERLAQFALQNPTVLDGRPAPPRQLPGRRALPVEERTRDVWIEEELQSLGRQLFDGAAGCRYCHPVTQDQGAAGLPVFQVSRIPRRWFEHGRFRHDKHRQLACSECHAALTSTATADVLLPRIDNCRRCHGPAGPGGSSCTTCHGYHDWKTDAYHGTLTIEQYLSRP